MPVLFPLAIFLSAALLFLVEPMFARMVLPLLGGAPAVWNTCVVLYQLLLFAGYASAHVAARFLSLRRQAAFYVALLAAGLVTQPIGIGPSWIPPADVNPVPWVFQLLVAVIGLPFFALAVSGPLLQHWSGNAPQRAAADPYRLYVASNAGSLLALLAYPLSIEPSLRLWSQSLLWTGLYGVLVLVIAGCAWTIWTAPAADTPPARIVRPAPRHSEAEAARDDNWRAEPAGWLALAFVPSSLMLSVTTYISTDIAAVPLLWIGPLSLYLLTFILAFAERRWIPTRLLDALAPLAAIVIVAAALAENTFPVSANIALQLVCFFVIALSCHQRLADTRPPAARLTEFYLWMSAGGAIGGLFTTLAAPLLFVGALEYPLVAAASCVLLPAAAATTRGWRSWTTWLMVLVPAVLAAVIVRVLLLAGDLIEDSARIRYTFVFLVPLALCYPLRRRPPQMALALALLMFQGSFVRFDERVPLFIERTFFGEQRVLLSGTEHILTSGTTSHGAQAITPDLRCEPLSYYSRSGPVGQIFDELRRRPAAARFAVVGLGTGTMASYAAPQQSWTFFEINPAVERIARNPSYFTYLRDCAPQAAVVIGDARLSLERTPDGAFDALFVDAFTSDAIPVHLLTTEAMALYFRKVAPGGLAAVHISNRYLDLTPVVAAVARAAGLVAFEQMHVPGERELRISEEISRARWVVLARTTADAGELARDARWQPLSAVHGTVWTDDYSNVFRTTRWGR